MRGRPVGRHVQSHATMASPWRRKTSATSRPADMAPPAQAGGTTSSFSWSKGRWSLGSACSRPVCSVPVADTYGYGPKTT